MPVVAFRAKRPMNYEVFRPLHRGLLAAGGWDVHLYGKEHGSSSTTLFDKVGALPAKRRPNWRAKFARPDVLVSADWILATRHAKATVQIFHGISGKGHNMNRRVADYDHVFLIGPWLRRRLIERGLVQAGDPGLHEIGFPKTDRLTDGSLDRTATLREHGLDPDKPTVLYAPTWGHESSLEKMGEEILAALSGLTASGEAGTRTGLDLNVICKPHDNSLDPRYGRLDWRSVLDAHARSHAHFATPAVWDVVPLMHAADLLITDLSSVAFEWLHLDRPAIFMTFEGQLDQRAGEADVTTWRTRIGTACSDPRALPELIAAELADPEARSEDRRAALHDVYYHPGHATAAALAALHRIAGLPEPAVRSDVSLTRPP